MKLTNQFTATAGQKPKWEKTDEGFLRCTARVLAERVMPYAREELVGVPDELNDDIVNMFVSKDTMSSSESLRSLEGAGVVIGEHNWLDPEVVKTYSVGQVAGTPRMDGPYLIADLLITDPKAIEDIMNGDIGEISAAYAADAIFEPGDHDGNPYNARQTKLRYNHIAVLPSGHGRAGADVRIINQKTKQQEGGKVMPDAVKVRVVLKNTGAVVDVEENVANAIKNEADAAEKKVVEAENESSEKSKSVEDLMNEAETAKGALDAANADLETAKGELSVYKEKLDELLDGGIEAAAEEMIAEQGEAESIVENAAPEDEKDKEELMNSIKGLRGSALHTAALTAVGVKCENMSSEALRGAFKAQVQISNAMKGRKAVSGQRMMNNKTAHEQVQQVTRTSRERLGFPAKQ